jgi:CubicO group peptidase (beta-lactamase class C family)
LLTHTAGLPEACGDDFERLTREDLVTRCLADVEIAPPGKFVYSNLGYSILAAVAEKVGKQPLETTLQERFFRRLGMQHTAYAFDAAWHDSLAFGYENGTAVAPISDRLATLDGAYWNLSGNGGMQATTEDMYTWYRALAAPSALADSVKQVLIAPHAQREDGRRYGYGWFLTVNDAGHVEQVSHTGSDGVFFAAFVWRPADRMFYYMVTNDGEKLGGAAARIVLRSFRPPAGG